MKVYISGPMTGLPEFNYPAFNAIAEALAEAGHEPINPARHGLIDGYGWADYMRLALLDLAEAEAIFMLDGWGGSRGANLEDKVARALDLPRLDPSPKCRCGHGFGGHMFGIAAKEPDDYGGCDRCGCMEFDPIPQLDAFRDELTTPTPDTTPAS